MILGRDHMLRNSIIPLRRIKNWNNYNTRSLVLLKSSYWWWKMKAETRQQANFSVSLWIYSVSSVTQLCPTRFDPSDCSTPGFPVHHQLPELAQTHVHRVGDAFQPAHPLSSPSPTINRYQHQGLFQRVSSSHQVAKVLQFQLQHQSFQWIFRTDFLEDGLAGSPCSSRDSQESSPTPQFKSISSLVLSFFIVQLSHPYMTTGKTIALTRWTFVGKVMSLLFNMLFKLVIAFLPRNKCLFISWLQSPSAVILKPPKIKSVAVSIVSPSICHEVMGPDAKILVFWMLSFKPAFSLSSFAFIITFPHKGGVICISEVSGISPGNLDSSLCFIQPGILHDVLCI